MKKIANNPYKVAMVGLDLTEMDDHLIRYTAMMSKILPIERIYFTHVARTLQLPKALQEEYPDLLEPLDESIESDIRAKVDRYFEGSNIEINYIVKEGNPIEKILKLSKIKNADLILMGRKKNLYGSGIVSTRIAQRCPCSLLLVTSDYTATIKKILVPVDFSDHAALATDLALRIQTATLPSDIKLINVYAVPTGYNKTGKSYKEFAAIMKGHAEKDFELFLQNNDFPSEISCEYLLTDDRKYPDLIYDYGEKNAADLIVIGSRGRKSISSILIGSVAEKLVYLDSHIPVLIVKEKGENMGFFDALMKL